MTDKSPYDSAGGVLAVAAMRNVVSGRQARQGGRS